MFLDLILKERIERDYNHPSIITWVTADESWGRRNIKTDNSQQSFSNMLFYQAKALDRTRLVSGNDVWEQTEHTDFLIKSRKFSGFCYTQLTDVMQETNGLLKEDRTPKLSFEKLENIFGEKIYE